jgi:hypothetical protein
MASFQRAVSPGSRKERHSPRDGEKEKDRLPSSQPECSDSAVNWMDVLKEAPKEKDPSASKTSAKQMELLGKRQVGMKIEPATEDTAHKGQPLGAAHARGASPNSHFQRRSSAEAVEQNGSSGKQPAPPEPVVVKRERDSSGSLYVEMPSLHSWQPSRDGLRAHPIEATPIVHVVPAADETIGKRREADDVRFYLVHYAAPGR